MIWVGKSSSRAQIPTVGAKNEMITATTSAAALKPLAMAC
jgi:hypothetical protein